MKNIISILVIIASIGIFFGVVKPKYADIKVQREEVESYKDTLEESKKLDAMVKSLETQINSLDRENMSKLEKLIPDTISNVNLIIDINNIAANSGLTLRNIELKEVASGKSNSKALYDSIDLSFNVSASYESFLSFLGTLERSLRLVDITNISFAPGDADRYDFKVTVRTYWLK
jgi:Tfp pilus assembly protein PilO